VNKHDVYPAGAAAIEAACHDRGVEVLTAIPFDEAVPESMAGGRPVTDLYPSSPAARALEQLWGQVRDRLLQDPHLSPFQAPRAPYSGNGAS
jgi:MinD superfamily P-loop ATPase